MLAISSRNSKAKLMFEPEPHGWICLPSLAPPSKTRTHSRPRRLLFIVAS